MLEDNIKSLIKILEDSSIDEMEVSTFWGKRRIRIRKNNIHQRNQDIEIIQDSQEQIKQNPIKQPHDLENKIISDTIKTEIHRYTTFSGPVHLPWHFVVAKKIR